MRKCLLVVAIALAIPASSLAANITFVGSPIGTPVAATTEDAFTYSTFSGGLFRDTQGNGDAFNMEGCSACGGGVLAVVRSDVVGGLFTFDAADIAYQFGSMYPITFRGYVGGVLVATDVFQTTNDSAYSSVLSNLLAGVPIDELRVQLDADGSFATVVDNLQVTPSAVPEPGTLALLGSALLGLAARRRRK